jgi:hypothetical protein
MSYLPGAAAQYASGAFAGPLVREMAMCEGTPANEGPALGRERLDHSGCAPECLRGPRYGGHTLIDQAAAGLPATVRDRAVLDVLDDYRVL